jgi:acyl-CoA synthetase (AMP-forming)/AMP-acid ligase II
VERQLAWTAEQIRSSHGLAPMDRGLTVLPFFHVNAPVVSLLASLLAGSAVVIAPRFRSSLFWQWVEQHRVTWASVVPTILAMLLETPAPARSSSSLRFLRTASAPLPALQLQRFEHKFGVPVIETYGLTEAASQVCANPLPPRRHVPGSVGRPVGFSLRICRPRAASWRGSCPLEDVPAGETGEVCIAGPGLIQAYVGDRGSDAFEGGWFRTGDLGYQDTGGYVYLVGRLRDVINRGGENVAPREVEEVLLTHSAVGEAAVVGRPDPLYGEQVVAYVVPRGAWTPALEDELHGLCARFLSPYKIPCAFMARGALPRTQTGKLDREALRREQARIERVPAGTVSVA